MRRAGPLRNGHLVVSLALLFLLPTLLFTPYLALWPRLVVSIGVVGVAALLIGRPAPPDGAMLAQPVVWRRLGACGLIATLLIVLGGEGHLVYANWDWLWRDAVLADLVRAAPLPLYQVDGAPYLMRAPLGMYLLPALIGRLGSLGFAHAALVAQNATILAGLLYIVVMLAGRRGFVVLLVFVGFAGLDIVGTMLMGLEDGQSLQTLKIPSMINSWAHGLQYSSAVTQLFWVPNHCLPGWWLALLLLLCVRREIGVGDLGIGLASCLLWSPLAALGGLPLAGVVFVMRLNELRDRRFWVAAILSLCFVPIAVYLVADSATVPHEVLITQTGFWIVAVVFLAVAIPQVLILVVSWRRLPPEILPLLAAATVVLIVLPMVKFGGNNDLVMRGSIPALAILALAFGEIVAQGLRPQPFVFAGALALVATTALTPGMEIARALRFPRFAISDCSLLTVWKSQLPKVWLSNYLASPKAVPAWLIAPSTSVMIEDEKRSCWPDIPFDPQISVFGHSNAELEEAMARRQTERSVKRGIP